MNKLKKKLDKKGIILIEALLALTVIVIVMTALVTALVSALSSTTFSNEQTMATAYAQEGLEIARALKNNDFETFSSHTVPREYCLGEGALAIDENCAPLDSKFERYIYINTSGIDDRPGASGDPQKCVQTGSIFVSSIVRWSGPKCTSAGDMCHEVALDTCFTNLK